MVSTAQLNLSSAAAPFSKRRYAIRDTLSNPVKVSSELRL
jgi:hypothetical protein